MWQLLVYLIILVIVYYLLYIRGYNAWSSLLIALVVALIFLLLTSSLSPKDIVAGNEQVAIVYLIIILTLFYIVSYAVYMALTSQ